MKRDRLEICKKINRKISEEFPEERHEEEVQSLGEGINRGKARRQRRARQTRGWPHVRGVTQGHVSLREPCYLLLAALESEKDTVLNNSNPSNGF